MSLNRLSIPRLDSSTAWYMIGVSSFVVGSGLTYHIQDGVEVYSVDNVENIQRAIEHYMFDTGNFLSISEKNKVNIGDIFLNRKNISGWNGPYYGYDSTQRHTISIDLGGFSDDFSALRYRKESWGIGPLRCSMKDCYIYLHTKAEKGSIKAEKLEKLYSELEKNIDSAVDTHDGKVRKVIDFDHVHFYYQVMPEYNTINS